MFDSKTVFDFLNECGAFFFASIEDGSARVRPFGFKMLFEGRLYFGMGSHKPSYRQVSANPNVEICGLKPDGSFIRVKGRAVFDVRKETQAEMFRVSPDLRSIYNEESGLIQATFYLTDIDAQIYKDGIYKPVE